MPESRKPVAVYTDANDTDVSAGIKLLSTAGYEVRQLRYHEPHDIISDARDADVLLVGYATVTREVIDALPRLRLIALMSMGVDNVDVEAATERGIWVTNVPAAATEEVATHTLALVLYAARRLDFYLTTATPSRWEERSSFAPRRLSTMTLGVVGLGKIGREFARLARPLFHEILGYDPLLPDTPATREMLSEAGICRAPLNQVKKKSDVLSLHLPLTEQTRQMVDTAFLAGMRPGAVLVNVSRGALVDSRALASSLDAGGLVAAALDVLDEEPPCTDHPLLDRSDVVLTPHVAYLSAHTEAEYVRIQSQNAVAVAATGVPISPVNEPRTPRLEVRTDEP